MALHGHDGIGSGDRSTHSDTKSDVEQMRGSGIVVWREGGIAGNAEDFKGDAAEVVVVTTRGRVGVPSRLSSKTHRGI